MNTSNLDWEEFRSAYDRERNVSRLGRTLDLAEARALTNRALIKRLTRLWLQPERNTAILALRERELSQEEGCLLEAALHDLAVDIESHSAKDRGSMERALMRIAKALPVGSGKSLVLPFLAHKRKARRRIGLQLLKKLDFHSEITEFLFSEYEKTRDWDLLCVLVNDAQTVIANHNYLLRELPEPYWRMRVIEICMKANVGLVGTFVAKYPYETIYAVGRLEDRRMLLPLSESFERFMHDSECLSIYAWTCGKLRAVKELNRVRKVWQQMRDEKFSGIE